MWPLCYWLLNGLKPVFFIALRRKGELLFTSLLVTTSNINSPLLRHLWRQLFFSSMRVSPSLTRSRGARSLYKWPCTNLHYYTKVIIEKKKLQEVLGTSFLRCLAILLCKYAIAFSQCLKLRSRLSPVKRAY